MTTSTALNLVNINLDDVVQTAAILESMLFVMDQPVTINELAKSLEITPKAIETALITLSKQYEGRFLRLQWLGKQVQLVTAPAITPYIERFLGLSFSSKLSTAALEALGVIVYKQPITRSEIEDIRGVSCDGVLRTLLSKGLIEEMGRLDTVGHPIQYGPTIECLQYFGLSSLDELPPLELEENESTEQ